MDYEDTPDEQDPDLSGVGGSPPSLIGLWNGCNLSLHNKYQRGVNVRLCFEIVLYIVLF